MDELIHGDAIEELKKLKANSVDTVITDPPYGIGFMGKEWDNFGPKKVADMKDKADARAVERTDGRKAGHGVARDAGSYNQSPQGHKAFQKWTEAWAREALRVTKPGGTILCFSGTRTQHSVMTGIEDAGWILKDCIMYLYGSGFPKATDIPKQLKKQCSCGNMEVYEKAQYNTRTTKETARGSKDEEPDTKHGLRLVQADDIQKAKYIEGEQREILRPQLQQQGKSTAGQTSKLPQFPKREGQSSMEGRHNPQKTKGKLQGSNLSEMPEEVSADGKKRRVHNAAPAGDGSTSEPITNTKRSGTPCRPQSKQQQDKKPCAFCQQRGTQIVREWNGWKSHGLKPAYEPIIVAMKPNDGTYANNALKHGVSGLNIDGGSIGTETRTNSKGKEAAKGKGIYGKFGERKTEVKDYGRFPANIILDEEAAKMLDEQSGESKSTLDKTVHAGKNGTSLFTGEQIDRLQRGDKGGASRFFYVAKASKAERNAGCEGIDPKQTTDGRKKDADNAYQRGKTLRTNHHPTVKPLKLMQYLVRLTKTPTGGKVLDPFMGSGTTGMACKLERREFIGIDNELEYVEIARKRITNTPKPLI